MSERIPEAVYVGLDWAAVTHAVCVISAVGKVLARFTIEHTAEGISLLISRLARYGDPADVQVGIERPNGRLVDLLPEAGNPVIPVSPMRSRLGGKARSSRARSPMPVTRLSSPSICGCASTGCARFSLTRPRQRRCAHSGPHPRRHRRNARAATYQLSSLLEYYWPGAKEIFADVESPISLAFLRRYPTAAAAVHLGEKRLAAFLTKHGHSGRRPATELVTRLRRAPAGATDPVMVEAIHDAVLALVTVLEALNAAGKQLDRSVIAHLGEHPDIEIFTSLPRSGQINAGHDRS